MIKQPLISTYTHTSGSQCSEHEDADRFKKIFEDGPLGMAIVNPSFTFIHVNKSFCDLLGYTEDELRSLTFKDITHPDSLPKDIQNVTNLLIGKISSFKTEKQYIHKDGTCIWASTTITSTKTQSGDFLHFLAIIENITERKRILDELLQSNEKLLKIIKTCPDGITITRLSDGTFIEINDSFTELTGYTAEEIIGHSSFQYDSSIWIYKEDRDKLITQLLLHGKVTDMEFPMKIKNGSIRIAQLSARILETNGEQFILAISKDITSRKNEEMELKNSKNFLELIFKKSPDASIITRLHDGLIVDVNERFLSLTEYSRHEVIGKTSIELNLYCNVDNRQKVINMLKTNDNALNFENRFRVKSGKEIDTSMSSQVITLNDEPHIFSIIHDITERKKTEQHLMNAQKLDSLGVLAGGIAHDFNNLLAGIYGYIDLALNSNKQEETREYLENTLATMDRAKALTMQLLTFAKGGAPHQKVTSLPELIKESTHFSLSGSHTSVSFFFENDLWPCHIDKNQITQVIDNIVINAQQAMPNGGTIEIYAQNKTFAENEHLFLTSGNYVEISIKDFGIGIPYNIMPRIFDPFYTTKSKGHGLGLATAYSIINRHKGYIYADSLPDKGSTFHIFLPATPEKHSSTIVTNLIRTDRGTIVIADDEEIVRLTLQKMIEHLGYSVTVKSDCKDAVDFFIKETEENRQINALIFDLTIPGGMGGIDATKEIRKLNQTIPIFVVSGYSDNSAIINPEHFGFTASISKPFTIDELGKTIRQYLS
jgi:PAS domain S-box-containing protein